MYPLKNAKWIWHNGAAQQDEYCEALEVVELSESDATLYISADSNYAVYVNGSLAAFGQYPDYPYDKVYDARDISAYIRKGRNVIAIRAWYYGIDNTQTYYPGKAGVIYSLHSAGRELLSSSEKSLVRPSPTYRPHLVKRITGQLGLSFEYDARYADAWLLGEPSEEYPFTHATEIDGPTSCRPRTCLPVELGVTREGTRVEKNGIKSTVENGIIFDLGCETVGFICLDFECDEECTVTVAFGEHLEDGHVRSHVGGRDFTFVYRASAGRNYYMNPYRRFGCRYVELRPDKKLGNARVSLRETVYPVTERPAPEWLSPTQRRIYDICVRTLVCCMHEHYEDCPWREQALYTMDSRNQMLTGYYAFGETLFPKSNLELIAADNREDGLLSVCYPILGKLAIPSFSLHFVTECEEYLRYSGDVDFIRRIYSKIKSVLGAFTSRIGEDGLIAPISGSLMWNFYEWQEGLSAGDQLHQGYAEEGLEPDIILNTLTSIALERISRIESALGITSDALDLRKALNRAINSHFYDTGRGYYRNRASEPAACRLGNALAILSGAATGERAIAVAEVLASDMLPDASLSMACFVYDALLLTDEKKYAEYILDKIERTYTPMLEYGNGTVWETELGHSDFHNAGSLCHGWSAIPVYYYHILGGRYNEE